MDQPKTRILAAASRLFLRGGAAALSVRAIAAEAELSTIGIYSHFQGKQGILDALYIEGFERVAEAMRVSSETHTPREAVRTACQNYLQSADAYQAHYQLIFGQADSSYQPSKQAQDVGRKAFEVLTDLVARLLPDTASKQARHDAAMQIWSVLHGFVGLRQHAVARLVDMRHWQNRALNTRRQHTGRKAAAAETASDSRQSPPLKRTPRAACGQREN
jgi:AcrR family transcriptional regulator